MPQGTLQDIAHTDIYLIDQILKGRYDQGGNVLDAGCGSGRNISWFVGQPNVTVFAVDADAATMEKLATTYPDLPLANRHVAPLQQLPFAAAFFDHVICQAVVHFASNGDDFMSMFAELKRVLKPGGSLFMRMASDIGLEGKMIPLGNGRFTMPDGTDRFLLNRELIIEILKTFHFALAEPVKTTNVDDVRCMTTLVLVNKV